MTTKKEREKERVKMWGGQQCEKEWLWEAGTLHCVGGDASPILPSSSSSCCCCCCCCTLPPQQISIFKLQHEVIDYSGDLRSAKILKPINLAFTS